MVWCLEGQKHIFRQETPLVHNLVMQELMAVFTQPMLMLPPLLGETPLRRYSGITGCWRQPVMYVIH